MSGNYDPSNSKPWFKDDLTRVLQGVHAAMVLSSSRTSEDYRAGFAAALVGVALVIGVHRPEQFMIGDKSNV